MSNCKNCISPEMCMNFKKDFCKAKSRKVKYKFVETDKGTKVKPVNYKCKPECFECRADKTCLVSPNFERENKNDSST